MNPISNFLGGNIIEKNFEFLFAQKIEKRAQMNCGETEGMWTFLDLSAGVDHRPHRCAGGLEA